MFFIPFGFVEYGNGDAMEVAKVVHPDDPIKFLHWKLTKMRQEFEKNMIVLMKKKRKMKKHYDIFCVIIFLFKLFGQKN